MASITSLMNSSSTSSIYGNRNVLSGLASGMDTETMIENAVSGIKLKIQNLQKKRTKIEWQQEAYRSIIDKAVNFNTKYTSYSSKTNLLSNSFFSNAVNTATLGTYKDKVTATGKSSSDIKLNAVKQMATAASYTTAGANTSFLDAAGSITGKEFDIGGTIPVSTVSGSLTFQYGGNNGTSFDISFGELENLNDVVVYNEDGTEKADASNAEKLAQAINNKLGEITYTYTKNGFQETTTADKAVKVTAYEDGRLGFTDALGNGNTVKISSSSGEIEKYASENVLVSPGPLTKDMDTLDYISNKELGITFNGTTKKISMTDVIERMGDDVKDNDSFVKALQEELDSAFGKGKITADRNDDGKLSFTADKGTTLSLGGSAIKALGFESGDSNYINTGRKLNELLGERADSVFTQANRLKGDGSVTEKTSPNGTVYYLDSKGNYVDKDGYRVDKDGKAIYDFEINGAHINVTEDTTLESLMNSINSNAEAGVKVSYSKLTNEFKFTATETGAQSKVEFGAMGKALFASDDHSASDSFSETYGLGLNDGEEKRFAFSFEGHDFSFMISSDSSMQDVADDLNLSLRNFDQTASYNELTGQIVVTDNKTGKMVEFDIYEGEDSQGGTKIDRPEFESSYTTGQDAVMDVEINGVKFDNFTRSSNTFDIDGLNITVKGEFTTGVDDKGNPEEAVTFQTTTDTDKIIDAIRSFVEDYNEMITEIKSAYSTQPAYNSNKARYEPLTAEQEAEYSETELAAYNEKAKQGILFGDTNLSSMYSKLLGAITPGGTDGQTLREIGIGTSYSDGLTTLSLDENKLRSALESDPDKVRNAFAKTKEGGSSSDGLMQTMQNTLNTYVKTTGEPKGVLITRAGSVKAPTSLNSNSLKTQIDNIDSQIDRWQDKMADQIDRYTTQFSRLEQLIAEMNSQASAMSGLMGGTGGY